MSADPTAPAGGSVKVGTTYLVFSAVTEREPSVPGADATTDRDIPAWKPVGEITASTPEAAMRQYAERSGSTKPLPLAAVATRYWATETLKPNTVTTWETAA